jgi:regulator of protease activity HflC (stomatin/prohibitin superfamily)
MKNKIIFFVLMVCMVSLTSCWKHVPPRFTGIKVKTLGQNKGVQPQNLNVGRYWVGAFWTLYTYPTHEVIYPFTEGNDEGSPTNEAMTFQDKDGIVCSVDIAITCHVEADKASTVFQAYPVEMLQIVKTYIRQDLNSAFVNFSSRCSANELYSTKKMEMLKYVQDTVTKKYAEKNIIVDGLAYKSNIRFPQNVMDAINTKIAATQIAFQKQIEISQAEADAKKVVAKAQGDYEAALLQAKGNKALAESITQNLILYKFATTWNGVSPVYSGTGVLPAIFTNATGFPNR